MADSPMQTTKREMQALARSRGVWIGIVAAGVILGIAGPFGTEAFMRGLPRVVYWVSVAAIGFLCGSAVSTFVAATLRMWRVPYWPSVVMAGALAGVVIFVLMAALNTAVFGTGFLEVETLRSLALNVIVISVIFAGAFVAMSAHVRGDNANAGTTTGTDPARILARVPIEKRGQLLALSVQDHYVEVITDKGSALVLLRLSDAMQEVGDVAGLQVHRSHWVATGAVSAAARDGAKAMLTLTNGRDIPVSRTYVPAIKEAGLLPR